MSKGMTINLTPKIRYQLFMYNYYLKYIKNNLYNEKYDEKYIPSNESYMRQLKTDIDDITEINDNERPKYNKSRGKNRKKLLLLSKIRYTVLSKRKSLLDRCYNFINLSSENKTKFVYKDYDDFFKKHINYYKFLQKSKGEFKKRYDKMVEQKYKEIYYPKNIVDLFSKNIEIDEVFNILEKRTDNIMYNVFM